MKTPKELWIEALRSGEYSQGKGCLSKDGNFCCLGVACDVYNKNVPDNLKLQKEINSNGEIIFAEQTYVLPYAVKNWLRIRYFNPDIQLDGNVISLAEANDDGLSFANLADIIEAQL